MAGKFFYVPGLPRAFSTLKELHAAARDSKIVKQKTAGEMSFWIEAQVAFTLHRVSE
jgi:hypothetical protein